MRLLIDTQIFIWTVLDSDSLSLNAYLGLGSKFTHPHAELPDRFGPCHKTHYDRRDGRQGDQVRTDRPGQAPEESLK